MQARLIRGICLLAFLLSVSQAEDLNDSKQSDESIISKLKETVILSENNSRQILTGGLSASDTFRPDVEHNNLRSDKSPSITSYLLNQPERRSFPFQIENLSDLRFLTPKYVAPVINSSKRLSRSVLNDVLSVLDGPEVNFEINEVSNTFPVQPRFSPSLSSDIAFGLIPTQEDLNNQGDETNKLNSLIGHPNKLPPLKYDYKNENGQNGLNLEETTDGVKLLSIDESKLNNVYPYTPNSERTGDTSNDIDELERSALYSPYQHLGEGGAEAYAGVNNVNNFNAYNQVLSPFPYIYSDAINPGSLVTANTAAQSALISGLNAKSRVIWPHEYIFPYKIMGGENLIRCTRQNEFHHFWSQAFDCLVCVCSTEFGPLQPVCASCSGCQPQDITPAVPIDVIPEPYVPLPIPPFPPYIPDVEPIIRSNITIDSTPLPLIEVPATCKPLPTEEPFTNPLQPCQLCVCREVINVFGKIDVRIDCHDNPHCVVPVDVNVLPPMPEIPVPVPLPLCEKFPRNVPFPHPTERCKKCKCSVELSAYRIPEQQITCFVDINCNTNIEPSPWLPTSPTPPIVVPVEPYPIPFPQPNNEIPYEPPLSPPEVNPIEPIPWPPVSTTISPPILPPPQVGPLPGPSPHKSCQPYPPNQPFQHPWDPCQICQCSESRAVGLVNVEISCYTKLTCCIVVPDDMIPGDSDASKGQEYQIYNGLIPGTSKLPIIFSKPDNLRGYLNPYFQALGDSSAIISEESNQPNQVYMDSNYLNSGSVISQMYDTVNLPSNKLELVTSKPRPLYNSYQSENSLNPYYVEGTSQYKNLAALPQKETENYAQQRELYMNPVNLATTKYNPQSPYKPEVYEYKDLMTSGFNPTSLYGQYNTDLTQNQDLTNIQYKTIYPTEKPFFRSYPLEVPQNQAYTSATAQSQNSFMNPLQNEAHSGAYALAQSSLNYPGYSLPSPYQTATAVSSVNYHQLSGVAEADAQSQIYPSYSQSASSASANIMPDSLVGYPYQTNQYTGYIAPQSQSYPDINNQGLDLYKTNPMKYIGKYDYNGQPNAINILKTENSYYPTGYSQNAAPNDLHLPLYPKQINYNMNPLQVPGQFAGSSAKASAVAKLQSKSGEADLEED